MIFIRSDIYIARNFLFSCSRIVFNLKRKKKRKNSLIKTDIKPFANKLSGFFWIKQPSLIIYCRLLLFLSH